jgi:hypothetical protein
MTRVAKFEKYDEDVPVCIIGPKPAFATPRANVGRFDFGICMAAFDGNDVIRTPSFDRDIETRTFTLLRADNGAQFAYSMSRFEKITEGRYSGWMLAIPEKFQDLAAEHSLRRHYYRDSGDKGLLFGESVLKPKERAAA